MKRRRLSIPRKFLPLAALPKIDGFQYFGARKCETGWTGDQVVLRVQGKLAWNETPEGMIYGQGIQAWAPMPHLPQPEPRSTWERWNLQRACVGEDNDCVPRAFAAAAGIPYAESLLMHTRAGRRKRRGMKQPNWLRAWEHAGYTLGEALDVKGQIRKVASDHRLRTGIWIILTAGHVTCVRDGEVHDWAANSRKRVIWCKPFVRVAA